MMHDKLLYDWLTVAVIGFWVIITPGPNMAIVLKNSLIHARSSGVYTAVGLALGNLIHIFYCFVGIGVLISKSLFLFTLLKWIGAGYLIFLGIKSLHLKSCFDISQPDITLKLSRISALRVGFLTDLLNPKGTLFFLAFFSQIVGQSTPMSVQLFYALTIVLLEFVVLFFVAVAVGHHAIRQRLQTVHHHIGRVTAAILIGLAVKVMATK